MKVNFKLLLPGAKMPEYQTTGAAAFDLCAIKAQVIGGGETRLIGTGLALEIPEGFVGLVCSRSGLASKHSVFVINAPGVIDSDFRGEICILLHNAGKEKFIVGRGDRVAQMLIQPAPRAWLAPAVELSETGRGASGFGSTGG